MGPPTTARLIIPAKELIDRAALALVRENREREARRGVSPAVRVSLTGRKLRSASPKLRPILRQAGGVPASDRRASKSVVMHRHLRATVLDNKRASLHAWQDRLRDPSLTVLLVLQVFLLFVALPLAATGVPIAQLVAWLLLLLAVTLVVILSQRGVAIVTILLGLVAAAASFALGREWSPITASVLNHGGFILAFSALIWVVAHALYAPGRITFHRLQGAMVVYLSLATIFANAFGLVWQLVPGAFANLPPAAPGASEFATMLYFSLATLTTTGYGDIVPLNPFARSLANLESVIGPFYLAITVARLVTMELEDRRRSRQ
jgi:voltage-gated potassium channel Kch